MIFSYINIVFEVAAHLFRAFGNCIILLPFAYFVGSIALDMCNGLSVILGLMAVASVIFTAVTVYMELEQAADEVRSFRYWHAAVQNR